MADRPEDQRRDERERERRSEATERERRSEETERRPVRAEAEGVDVRRAQGDVGVREAHARFGGIDVPASLVGMLTALATLLILGGLASAAIGAFGYQTGLDREDIEEVTIGGLIAALVVLFLAYLIGGWAAGRMARYDGARNGLMTVVWTLILAAILGGLGAWLGDEYDVLQRFELPQWFSEDAFTTSAIVSGLAGLAAMLIGGLLGGGWGERYHRRADATIVSTRPGGMQRLEADRR